MKVIWSSIKLCSVFVHNPYSLFWSGIFIFYFNQHIRIIHMQNSKQIFHMDPIFNLILHYLTQGGIPLIITSFQKLNRQKCRKDSNIWFWYPVLSQNLTIVLFSSTDNNKSSWYVLNRTTVIYIFTCVQ